MLPHPKFHLQRCRHLIPCLSSKFMDEPWVIYRSITSHPHLSETSTEHHWCMLWYIWIVFLQSSSFSDLWNMVWNFSLAPNIQFACKNSLGVTEVKKNQKLLITYNKSKKIFWPLLHMQKLWEAGDFTYRLCGLHKVLIHLHFKNKSAYGFCF